MLIDFTSAGQIVSVSEKEPLPVAVRKSAPDVLLIQTTNVGSAGYIDLKGSTNDEEPTLVDCLDYKQLLWTFHVSGDGVMTAIFCARATDDSNQPLGPGWITLDSITMDVIDNTYYRLDIPPGGIGHYDQYQIKVGLNEGGPVVIKSKIIGIR